MPSSQRYLDGFPALVDLLDELLPELEKHGLQVAARKARTTCCSAASAVCSEGVLQMQEMTQVPSESVATLEYAMVPSPP